MKRCKKNRKARDFKNQIRKATAVVITTVLVSYPLGPPHINAYFTDKIIYGEAAKAGRRTLNSLGSGAIQLFYDVYRFDDLKADFDVKFSDNVLVVTLCLPEGFGFSAQDTLHDSVRFIYDKEKIDVIPKDMKTKGNELQLIFDWKEIEKFIDGDKSPHFQVAGKGMGTGRSGLGERYTFQGQGRISDLDLEYFGQSDLAYDLRGPRGIVVPDGGTDTYYYRFTLGGQEVAPEDIEWTFRGARGVGFSAGNLTVSSEASSGSITISARLKANKYFARELGIELTKIIEEVPPLLEPLAPPEETPPEEPPAIAEPPVPMKPQPKDKLEDPIKTPEDQKAKDPEKVPEEPQEEDKKEPPPGEKPPEDKVEDDRKSTGVEGTPPAKEADKEIEPVKTGAGTPKQEEPAPKQTPEDKVEVPGKEETPAPETKNGEDKGLDEA